MKLRGGGSWWPGGKDLCLALLVFLNSQGLTEELLLLIFRELARLMYQMRRRDKGIINIIPDTFPSFDHAPGILSYYLYLVVSSMRERF